MKVTLIATVLLMSSAIQASTFDCFSHEEMGPVHTMTIAAVRPTTDMDGRQFSARSVVIKEYNKVVMHADAIGSASAKKIDLMLLVGGDMMMGSIAMKKTMPGRLSGNVKILGSDNSNIDMTCVLK